MATLSSFTSIDMGLAEYANTSLITLCNLDLGRFNEENVVFWAEF